MRAWLVAKQSGLNFQEVNVTLDQPTTIDRLKALSPSERVPCLIHDDLKIWDSLAISEYLAELSPGCNLWPEESKDRAIARSYVAEMHSGFSSLRAQLSMDIRLKIEVRHLMPQTVSDIRRIIALWENAIKKSKGPFLFGSFGIVDAFYAPVVFRFLSYGIKIESPEANAYINSIQNQKFVQTWVEMAHTEKPDVVRF